MKVNEFRVLLLAILILIPTFFFWSIASVHWKIFPYSTILEISDWLKGPEEGPDIKILDKIREDFLGKEIREAGESRTITALGLGLEPVSDPGNMLAGTRYSIKYYSNARTEGVYTFFTLLNLDSARYAIVQVDTDGVLVNVIPVVPDLDRMHQGGITDFGDFLVMENPRKRRKKSISAYDYCGNFRTRVVGGFHHKSSGDQEGFWAWNDSTAEYRNYTDGKLEKSFTMLDLVSANEEITVLEPRLLQEVETDVVGRWKYSDIREGTVDHLNSISLENPFHQNDIDVLTSGKAHLFPMFDTGDLLLSFRSINTIVVIDPDSLKIKWFAHGEFSRQHDPDWSDNGEITVYDNRPFTRHSRIIQIDPVTKTVSNLVAGEHWSFYQWHEGMSDFVPPDGVVFTNESEILHISENRKVEFAIVVESPSGKLMKLKNPRFFSMERHKELLSNCGG